MLIYASSSPEYFAEHGGAFISSAKKNGHEVRVDMSEDFPRSILKCQDERSFKCFVRYLNLPELLDQDSVLMMDIDSIINKPIRIEPEYDLGLYFRPWTSKEKYQVLMTASYWTPKAKPFAMRLRQRLLAQNNKWYDDQIAVWRLYQEMGEQFNVKKLTQDFVCYHFDRDAPIWTCKGPNRKNNQTYLERRAAYA